MGSTSGECHTPYSKKKLPTTSNFKFVKEMPFVAPYKAKYYYVGYNSMYLYNSYLCIGHYRDL